MEVQINCPVHPGAVNCNKNTAEPDQLTCQQLKNVQGDISAVGQKFKSPPNLAILNTPISFLQRATGLADIRTTSSSTPLPATWSWCQRGGNMISPVANQGPCGSCWAVASTTALADRYGVKYNIQAPDLSSAWTILQIGTTGGPSSTCQCSTGGLLAQAACGFESTGVVQEACYPYEYVMYYMRQSEQGPLPPIKNLQSCCSKDENNILFTVKDNSTQNVIVLDGETVDVHATHNKLKAEIANNGPVAATFQVYTDFQPDYYRNHVENAQTWEEVGVYNPNNNSGTVEGGHAVVITGWGTTKDGQDFWEVRNSWGTDNIPEGQGIYRGYFKYAIVDNDPCHLAAPGMDQQSIIGGGVSFLPGPLPKGYKTIPGNGKRPSPDNYGDFSGKPYNFFSFKNPDGSLNWPFISILILVLAIIVALVVQFIP